MSWRQTCPDSGGMYCCRSFMGWGTVWDVSSAYSRGEGKLGSSESWEIYVVEGNSSSFLAGTNKVTVSSVFDLWIHHPYGWAHKNSPDMFSSVQKAPYLTIGPMQPAMTLFAVQISIQELVSNAEKAVQPDAGLHVHIPSVRRPQKKNVTEVDWTNIRSFTHKAIWTIHWQFQPLLCHILIKVMTQSNSKTRSHNVGIVGLYSLLRETGSDAGDLGGQWYSIKDSLYTHSVCSPSCNNTWAVSFCF